MVHQNCVLPVANAKEEIVETEGVPHAACPKCGARCDLMFLNGVPHIVCMVPDEEAGADALSSWLGKHAE